jgi:hypothetical protein
MIIGVSEDITNKDVQHIRTCAEALQIMNTQRYGKGGTTKLRAYSERAKEVADKIEAKLKL